MQKKKYGANATMHKGAVSKNNCQVCNSDQCLVNYPICSSCFAFFEKSVRNVSLVFCTCSGTYDMRLLNINGCDFCRLSKCYWVGMDSLMANVDITYVEQRNLRMNQPAPPLLVPLRMNWENTQYILCLQYMEQYYYQWLNLSSKYQAQSDENKKLLRERSFCRGTALQLIERSYVVHDVLWLHNCFYDPYSCDIPVLRPSAVMILNLLINFRSFNITLKEFHQLKLKLALKDDVKTAVDAHIGSNIFDAINAIGDELLLCHSNGTIPLRNAEDPALISERL